MEISSSISSLQIILDNSRRLRDFFVGNNRKVPSLPDGPIPTTPRPVLNLDNELLEASLKQSPEEFARQAVESKELEDKLREHRPEWFDDDAEVAEGEKLLSPAVIESLNQLPADLAAKMRHIIENSPPEYELFITLGLLLLSSSSYSSYCYCYSSSSYFFFLLLIYSPAGKSTMRFERWHSMNWTNSASRRT